MVRMKKYEMTLVSSVRKAGAIEYICYNSIIIFLNFKCSIDETCSSRRLKLEMLNTLNLHFRQRYLSDDEMYNKSFNTSAVN